MSESLSYEKLSDMVVFLCIRKEIFPNTYALHRLKRREDALRRTRKMSQAIYITTSFLAKQVPLALSNTAGSRMCQGIFFVLKKKKEN